MSEIKKFILKDVRCFEGRQEFNIRPLTFLVGENSTGKSTVLGCMQALGDIVASQSSYTFEFDFDAEPYGMGVFGEIARSIGNLAKETQSFELGFEIQMGSVTLCVRVTLIEQGFGGEPIVARVEIEFDLGVVVCEAVEAGLRDDWAHTRSDIKSLEIKNKSGVNTKPVYVLKTDMAKLLNPTFWEFDDPDYPWPARLSFDSAQDIKKFNEFVEKTTSLADRDPFTNEILGSSRVFPPCSGIRFESFAPVRAKPMRIYNLEMDERDPEGSSVPMTLINLHRRERKQWEAIRGPLVEFGKSSGLFTDIDMFPLGHSVKNPFQILIQVGSSGPRVNVADVGYGISQILPILVRVFTARQKTTFLVQQPEVHLHPKGQAALCSLFADIAKQRGHSFVVETHSDYMVNRARIEIMNGKISPDDVSLIYLEPGKNKVKAHNITFDENANFDPPKSYGEFFLRESNRVLGFED